MRDILFLLRIILAFQNSIDFSDTTSSNESAKHTSKKMRSKWTPDMENALIKICSNIPPGELYYFEKLKEQWHKSHSDYNISDATLYQKMYQIPEEITGKVKRPKDNFKWNDEKIDELVNIFLETNPYNKSHPVGVHEEWERRHPDFPRFGKKYLASIARKYLSERSPHVEEESVQRLFEWTNKQDSELYHIHHTTLSKGRQQPIYMHKIWADLHPDHRDLTYDQLVERVKYLQRNLPDEYFPWTKEQNKELLEIYHNTSPGVADQGQRIYDIWSKIHPRYNFMTPYYLQVHASTLAHHEERRGSKKRKKIMLKDEGKSNLVDLHKRLSERNRPLYDFHEAWVRKYPSLAHLTALNLRIRVKKLIAQDGLCNSGISKDKELSDNTQLHHRKYHKYTAEEKAELLTTYRQTYPREYKHSNRILEEWIKKQKNNAYVQGSSLKRLIQDWIEKDSDGKGKAPLVILKIEAKSESSTSASNSLK